MLTEELSISSLVDKYSLLISNCLKISIFKNHNYAISELTKTPRVDGCITANLGEFNPYLSDTKVYYSIYFADSREDFKEHILPVIISDCESDYNEKYIRIVSYMYGGKFADDFTLNITHELTNLFQYGQGLKKDFSFYSKVLSLIRSKYMDERYVGMSLYYTFKHEQDASVHEFYEWLCNSKCKLEFEEAIEFSDHKKFRMYNDKVANLGKAKLKYILQTIDINYESYKKRIYYAKKRFYKKFFNAYRLYCLRFRHSINEHYYFDTYFDKLSYIYKNLSYKIEPFIVKWEN